MREKIFLKTKDLYIHAFDVLPYHVTLGAVSPTGVCDHHSIANFPRGHTEKEN